MVVLGHLIGSVGSECAALSFLKGFVYQFHVPLFFFLSGLFFKEDETWKAFLTKKIKRLYVPFVVFNLLFQAIDILLRITCGISIIPVDEIKHAIKIILQLAVTPLGGATWFLIALFRAAVLYKILFILFKRSKVIVCALCLIAVLFRANIQDKYLLSVTLVALFFYSLGFLLKDVTNKLDSLSLRDKLLLSIPLLSAFVIILPHNRMDVSACAYQNLYLAILSSVLGIIMVLSLSSCISTLIVSKPLSFLGSESMSILTLHFFAFKLVTLVQILYVAAPGMAILSHPCYNVSGIWGWMYLFVGIALPLALSFCYNQVKQVIAKDQGHSSFRSPAKVV